MSDGENHGEENQSPPGSNDAPPPPPGDSAPPPPGGAAPPPPPSGAAPPPPYGAAPPAGGGGVSENRTVWYVLSYLWLLALIPFLMEKDDAEVQWHAKHGLVLLGAEILVIILLNVFSWAATAVLGPLACFGCFAFVAFFIAQVVLHIACIVKAVQGGRLLIPGLSEFADQF